MDGFISVGFGNYIHLANVNSITHADSAPMKRLIQLAKDQARAVDATQGRKTKAVIVMSDGSVVLSALLPDTIVQRANMIYGTTVKIDNLLEETEEEKE